MREPARKCTLGSASGEDAKLDSTEKVRAGECD